MRIKIFPEQYKIKENEVKINKCEDLFGFVSNQFKELAKKNLSVPIKLFQL